MPSGSGRPRNWVFARGRETQRLEILPRIAVNEALLIIRLITSGAGIGIISGYVCADLIDSGALVNLFPAWQPPPVDVSLVFARRRETSPVVRAFLDFMRAANGPDVFWKREPVVGHE